MPSFRHLVFLSVNAVQRNPSRRRSGGMNGSAFPFIRGEDWEIWVIIGLLIEQIGPKLYVGFQSQGFANLDVYPLNHYISCIYLSDYRT